MKDILWTNYGQAARYYSCIAWSQCCFRYRWSQHSPRQIIVKTWFERHVLPLTGSDLISLAVPSDSLFGELYVISLTCDMVFLKARVLTPFFTVYASALFGDIESTSQLFIVMPMTFSYTSRLVPRRTLAIGWFGCFYRTLHSRQAASGCLRLLMNDAQTLRSLLIDTRQQLAKVTIDSITAGHSFIAPQSPVRNLGVWLDSNLSVVIT